MPIKRFSSQIRPLLTVLISAYFPALLLLSVVALLSSKTSVPIAHFTRDTVSVAGAPFYAGILSQIGILLWSASASICLLTSAVLHRVSSRSKTKAFILGAGLLTVVLMLDDAFLVHEKIAPRYFHLSSNILFALYGVMITVFLISFRHIILRSDYILLVVSFGFLAASVVFDKLHDYGLFYLLGVDSVGVKYLLEDGCKLLGIAGWFTYWAPTCFVVLVNGTKRACLKNTKSEDLGKSPFAETIDFMSSIITFFKGL